MTGEFAILALHKKISHGKFKLFKLRRKLVIKKVFIIRYRLEITRRFLNMNFCHVTRRQ